MQIDTVKLFALLIQDPACIQGFTWYHIPVNKIYSLLNVHNYVQFNNHLKTSISEYTENQ